LNVLLESNTFKNNSAGVSLFQTVNSPWNSYSNSLCLTMKLAPYSLQYGGAVLAYELNVTGSTAVFKNNTFTENSANTVSACHCVKLIIKLNSILCASHKLCCCASFLHFSMITLTLISPIRAPWPTITFAMGTPTLIPISR
jgi:hypothetical protein